MQYRGLVAKVTGICFGSKEGESVDKMEQDYNHRHHATGGNYLSSGDQVWVPVLNTMVVLW